MRVAAAALLALVMALLAGPAAARDPGVRPGLDAYAGAALDYALRCKGCHGLGGEGAAGRVPRLAGFVGWYTRVPGGREYLMRVPGVARARLDDARLAAVLNWMLADLSPAEVKPGMAPFTAGEVGAARREPLVGREERRAGLVAEMRRRGLIGEGEDGLGEALEKRAAGRWVSRLASR